MELIQFLMLDMVLAQVQAIHTKSVEVAEVLDFVLLVMDKGLIGRKSDFLLAAKKNI